MTQLTNPTNEQELRERIEQCFTSNVEESSESIELFDTDRVIADIATFITAYTKAEIAKALIKELENVDKLTRPTLPDSGSVEMNVRAWCMDRIAILAKIKEV